jgi:hypothetical protein
MHSPIASGSVWPVSVRKRLERTQQAGDSGTFTDFAEQGCGGVAISFARIRRIGPYGIVNNLRGFIQVDMERGLMNVSIDGVGDDYARVRGFDGFARADRAVIALRKISKHVGINCVITRHNFDALDKIFAYAKKRRLREIELLRFKPSGRGASAYENLRCSDEQHRQLVPLVLKLARKFRLRVRLDCSYTPMVTHHKISPRVMQWLAIYGCAGGDLLVGAKATGAANAPLPGAANP